MPGAHIITVGCTVSLRNVQEEDVHMMRVNPSIHTANALAKIHDGQCQLKLLMTAMNSQNDK